MTRNVSRDHFEGPRPPADVLLTSVTQQQTQHQPRFPIVPQVYASTILQPNTRIQPTTTSLLIRPLFLPHPPHAGSPFPSRARRACTTQPNPSPFRSTAVVTTGHRMIGQLFPNGPRRLVARRVRYMGFEVLNDMADLGRREEGGAACGCNS